MTPKVLFISKSPFFQVHYLTLIVTYYIKWVTTSWTYRTTKIGPDFLDIHIIQYLGIIYGRLLWWKRREEGASLAPIAEQAHVGYVALKNMLYSGTKWFTDTAALFKNL